MIQPAIHVQFGKLGETADAFAVHDNLRHGARAMGHGGKLLERHAIKIDADFVIADAALVE